MEDILGEGVYSMDARLPISEACGILGCELPSSEAHTVGGL